MILYQFFTREQLIEGYSMFEMECSPKGVSD